MAEIYTSVGKLGKPHGIRGAFRFLFHRELKNNKKHPDYLIIQQQGNSLPWFIVEIEWLGFNEGLIFFEDITTPEKARKFSGSELMVSEKELKKYFKNSVGEFAFLIGFIALQKHGHILGTIIEVAENPGQILCTIEKENGEECMVPLVDAFIVNTDKRKKEIVFDLPEGLLDI